MEILGWVLTPVTVGAVHGIGMGTRDIALVTPRDAICSSTCRPGVINILMTTLGIAAVLVRNIIVLAEITCGILDRVIARDKLWA